MRVYNSLKLEKTNKGYEEKSSPYRLAKRVAVGGNAAQKVRRKNISEPLTKSPKGKKEVKLRQVDSDAAAALKADSHVGAK